MQGTEQNYVFRQCLDDVRSQATRIRHAAYSLVGKPNANRTHLKEQ